jgi:hypothetical protein
VSAWTFDGPDPGWKAMMGLGDMTCAEGRLQFKTLSADPALMADTYGVAATDFSKAVITMQLTGAIREGARGQLFWSADAGAMTEAASASFPLATDGQRHPYTIDLKANPRWRNRITALRLDPCDTKDLQVVIEEIRLEP